MLTIKDNYNYYKGLDALRGIAVLGVIFYHYYFDNIFFRLWWIFLEFFFVLSGFLITKILLSTGRGKKYLYNFYIRRILRIFPAYYFFLILFYLIINISDKVSLFDYYNKNALYFLGYIHNWLFVFVGTPKEHHLNHLWSLALEEQFYLLWPILLFFIKTKRKIIKALLIIISIAIITRVLIWYVWGNRLETYYCNSLTRIDSIAIGCLLACGFKFKAMLPKIKYAIIIVCFSIPVIGITLYQETNFTNPFFATLGYTSIAILFAFFLNYFIDSNQRFGLLKNNVVLNFTGKISYGMYIVHMPVYLFCLAKAEVLDAIPIPIKLTSLLITIGYASFSFYFIEAPILRLKKFFPMVAKNNQNK